MIIKCSLHLRQKYAGLRWYLNQVWKNNLLHSTQLQSVADYLLQVVYSFCLKRQKPSS